MGPDDRHARWDLESVTCSWIVEVWVAPGRPSSEVIEALHEVAQSVREDGVGDPASMRLRVDGASANAIRARLRATDIGHFTIDDREEWRVRVAARDALYLRVSRFIGQAAIDMSDAASDDAASRGTAGHRVSGRNHGTSTLDPKTRRALVRALLEAFPEPEDLVLVFNWYLRRKMPAIIAKASESQYDSVVDRLISDGDLDAFICAASQKNPGNPLLRRVVADELADCRKCRRTRVTGCPEID